MPERLQKAGLSVDKVLAEFIETEALNGLPIGADDFWQGLSDLVTIFGEENRALLDHREALQAQIDAWHVTHRDAPHDPEAYTAFLTEIGYLTSIPDAFSIETSGIDPEIAQIAGPQLVVPVTNARYALNAANARWGSLYDALYGTDAMGDLPKAGGYDAARGAQVIDWAKAHLDRVLPLAIGSWAQVTGWELRDGVLLISQPEGETGLSDPSCFVGTRGENLLMAVNGMHIEICVDPSTPVGSQDPAGICDIKLESAVSAIMDCEDSVAAVDGEEKVGAYRNWLGLMRGDLTEEVTKGGRSFTRALAADLDYTTPDGEPASLKGRALMLVRNVGHLMTTPAVLDDAGREIGEGLLDALVTTTLSMHDLRKTDGARNSVDGSVYVVKPKMHGPDEVAFADTIFSRVEAILGLPQYTVKLGIMDEERRTSVNLAACIHAAKHRVAFINTGFLDRTGDEIHTSMEAGPMVRKGAMKDQAWIASYEDRNVDIGLACGLKGRAQIGKGMWAMPDRMADMLAQKGAHPKAGANCAWVPSPTAATLHATHYHLTNVAAVQDKIAQGGARGTLADLLTIPTDPTRDWSAQDIADEVENNAQGILGYVVRWVDQGVGCSKVPDIHDVGLMEDRATCRISSQLLSNWLHHAVISTEEVEAAMRKMAAVVDGQNADDPTYTPMAPSFDGQAFRAACDLVLKGRVQPSGYTEPILHARRLVLKQGA